MKKTKNENLKILFYVGLLFLASRLLLIMTGCIYNYLTEDYSKTWDLLYHFDAEWYTSIIDHGYMNLPRPDGQASYAFYPLYPMIVKFIKHFLPETYTANQIGILVSNFCIYVAAVISVKFSRLLHKEDTGYFFAFLLFFAPHSMYFSMTYTEAMFMLFTIAFFYVCYQKKFLAAAVFACLAALTRIVGIFLVFSLLIFMYQADYEKVTLKNMIAFIKGIFLNPLRLFEIMICPLGIFGYLYYLYRLVGDVWASAHIEVAWHHSYNNLFKALYMNLLSPGSGASSQYWSIWGVLGFVLIGYLIYKKYYAEALFGLLSIVVPLNTDVLAASRYVMGNVVFYIALYEMLNKKQTAKIVVMNSSIVIYCVLLYMWFSENCFFVF